MSEDRGEFAVEEPWARAPEDVAEALGTPVETGLSEEEAERRRGIVGPNRLREYRTRSPLSILADQFKSVIVVLLGAAAALSFLFGGFVEGVAIVAVLLINAAIGFAAEMRALSSMEALRKLGDVYSTVRRDGEQLRVSAQELVPGDVVLFEGGDVVTADVRILESSRLQANESALTGESVPVEKSPEPVGSEEPLADRTSMLYKGTSVTRGSSAGVVVETGMETELGHISSLVEQAEEERTPLQERLDALGRRLVWVVLLLSGLVAAVGIRAGRDTFLIVETAIALAVAAIPEGLPIVATLALARGMWRMAKRDAVVNRLSAVETLGSTNVILTDKTGTLTENRMTVTRMALEDSDVTVEREDGAAFRTGEGALDPDGDERLRRALQVGVLCNNASLKGGEEGVGDPTEVALLAVGREAGIERKDLLEDCPEVGEESFDPEVKMMATFHDWDSTSLVAVKGAPEHVIDASTRILTRDGVEDLGEERRERWRGRTEELAGEGLRVLALAFKETDDADADPYRDLVLTGLVGLLDPPRRDVAPSIRASQDAGIRVIMITGDQALTALNVANAVGIAEGGDVVTGRELEPVEGMSPEGRKRLLGTSVFARVDPEQKMTILKLHQEEGAVVAMIGDGVNDAPALKRADIGVAMGQRGTQVAQEASDMVLRDDRFDTIVRAIEQGRAIFNNIRKFVVYLLSCNVSEVLVVSGATLANAPLPILPLQILFLNLITDVFPALALGVGESGPGVMKQSPRDPGEPVLTRRHWLSISWYGVLITASVLASLGIALTVLELEGARATTISFLVLAFAQLFHVFNMEGTRSGVLVNEVTRNRWVWGAVALSASLIFAGLYVPVLSDVLSVVAPGREGWILVGTMSLFPLVVGRLVAAVRRLRG